MRRLQPRAGPATATLVRLLALLAGLKLAVLAADPVIRIYLGDSAAYLAGALRDDLLPTDRSFTYSWMIRGCLWPFQNLRALLVWQGAAGIAVALVFRHLLVTRLNVPTLPASAATCALALEPAQLYYERMVLAETFGLLAFAAFVACAAAYLAARHACWLPLVAIAGLLAASLRLMFLPLVLVVSATLPLWRLCESPRPPTRQLLGHAAVAVLCVAALHTAYRAWVAALFDVPASYVARAGFMQLGLITPLLTPAHFERVGLPADYPARLQYPLGNRAARLRHMWSAGGLVSTLRQDGRDVEPIARELARMAIADDPLGLVRLGLATTVDYFRPDAIENALHNDLGRREIPPEVLWSLREYWGYDAAGLPTRETLISRYFQLGTWWLVACLFLLLPLALAGMVLHWHTPRRTQALLVGLIGIGLAVTHVLVINVAFYRYLHPLPFFIGVNALPFIALVTGRTTHSRTGESRSGG